MDEHIRLLTQIAGDVGEIKSSVANVANVQEKHGERLSSLEGSRNKMYGFMGAITLFFSSTGAALMKYFGH